MRDVTKLRAFINKGARALKRGLEVEELEIFKTLDDDTKCLMIGECIELIGNSEEFAEKFLKLNYEQKKQVCDLGAAYLYRERMDKLTKEIRGDISDKVRQEA